MGLLGWSITFLIVAVVAAVLGFGLLADVAATIAKWIFVVFVIFFLIGIIRYLVRPKVFP